MEFRARPFMCGAVGAWEPARIDRLTSAAPAPVRPLRSGPHGALLASAPPLEWRAAGTVGWSFAPLAEGTAPRSWTEAAESRLSAGFVVDGATATLHTCALGLQEVYTRRIGDAVYFASRIEPLLELDDSPLRTDWTAWVASLAFGAPIGAATPFEEVRRMTAASAWIATADGIRQTTFEPSWLSVEPDGAIGPGAVLDVLNDQVPRPRGLGRVAVTLSGGWDSRLLGAIAASRSRRSVLAWTTSPDDGTDDDIALSRPVAQALGMRQSVRLPDWNGWLDERTNLYERVQHQTWLHTWLMPLASELRGRSEPLLDGLAGDVLLKSLFVDRKTVEAQSPQARRDALWRTLTAGRLEQNLWYAEGVAARWEEAAREAYDAATADLAGRPAELTMSVLLTRTARVVAPSPLCLFAPEADVRLPFVHPSVITAALRVPLAAKIGGSFYRALLDSAAGAEVAALRSTNDPGTKPASGRRRQTEPGALAAMTDQIAADDVVRSLLGPQLLPALTDPGERARICASNGPRSVLQWASMFAHWRAKYAGRLVS